MKIAAGTRRIDYDLIRVFACASVLIFHFNASVCGFDTVGWSAYPNELIPSVYLGCVSLGDIGNNLFFMLSGAVLTESVFGVPGIGRLAVNAIETRDMPLLQGTVIFTTILIIAGNLVADLLYNVLDPRIREGA